MQDDNKESQIIGSVGFRVYKSYFLSVNSYLFLIIVAVLFILAQGAISSVDLFVSKWYFLLEFSYRKLKLPIHNYRVNWEDKIRTARENGSLVHMQPMLQDLLAVTNETTSLPFVIENGQNQSDVLRKELDIWDVRNSYISTYSIAMLVVLYLVFQRSFAFFQMCLIASRRLHDKLFRGITRGMMYFFNTNPSGRILNRFSKDIGNVDTILPVALMDCILVSFFFFYCGEI